MTRYHKAGRLIRLLGWLALVPVAFIVALGIPSMLSGDPGATPWATGFVVLLFVGVAFAYLKIGSAVKQHREWARIAGLIVGGVSLFGFPIGTAIGVFVLYYLGVGWDD